MSISAMKQALEALNYIYCPTTEYQDEVMEEALYALRQAIAEAEKQEPVAYAEITKEYVAVSDEPFENATPLYTKREWVGLTYDEVNILVDGMKTWNSFSLKDIYIAIEQALKEKNT